MNLNNIYLYLEIIKFKLKIFNINNNLIIYIIK